ncbi:DUF7709 family protein [Actinoplanes solisilvae]|uniref:DUF7709 family protein n=1 Tax=Actinoplanes solisilvae TaxID=2486853 RepID=UPI000FDA0B93|nr:hypothetical protein [Actinoplanes solisilvae]
MADDAIVRPEDVLPDGAEFGVFENVQVRKGTIAAFIANVRALDGLEPGTSSYDAVADQLRAAVPALRAVGLFDIFEVRSAELREVLGVS